MRLLFFIVVAFFSVSTTQASQAPRVEEFALNYAPAYAEQAFRKYYRSADSYTKSFVKKKWAQAHREMNQAGIPTEHQTILYLLGLWESTWNHRAQNPRSSAYGLCQTMLSDHQKTLPADFKENPVAQIRWCDRYAHERYGGYRKALDHWREHKWW